MARRKKKGTKRRTVRRTRTRSIGAIDMNQLLYSGVGGLSAQLINKIIPATWDAKMVAGGKLALGVALPMVSKDAKTKKMLSDIGSGMVAVSIVELLQSFGFMAGIGFAKPNEVEEFAVVLDSDRLQRDRIGADVLGANVLGQYEDDDISVINGVNDIAVMNMDTYEMQDSMLM